MSFDSIAQHYRWMECILAGEKLQRCRTRFLHEIPTPRNILFLGEGHGRCLAECCSRFPDASLTCVDASAKMLQLARRRMARVGLGESKVEFVHADILEWRPRDQSFDLIVTNFFLDCFRADQLERIVSLVSAVTTIEANWLIADFQTPASGLKRLRAQLIIWIMYVFFRVITQIPAKRIAVPDTLLECAGFTRHRRIETEWGLLRSDWWRRVI